MAALIGMLRDSGVREVHVRLAAPRYEYGCYMGMDTSDVSKLVASNYSDEEICMKIGADSIGFNSVSNVERSINEAREAADIQKPLGSFCTACATGEYPIKGPSFLKFQKHEAVNLEMPIVPSIIKH